MRSILILLLLVCVSLNAASIQVVKKESAKSAPTLLLMGGIQGDEPGGFNATDIFLMHYKILSGSVWVVPVLNRYSMLRNHRGVYGDLNRKFAYLSRKDPEYPLIQSIKKIITAKEVSAILHLHDGSGFYRPRYESPLLNPRRWGNSSIIDQDELPAVRFGHLKQVSQGIIANINKSLLKPLHRYYIRNTHTARGNVEMEKALTYFAIKHKKPAFANEASKELPLPSRVYYHLLAIEGLLKELGIKYSKDFNLSPENLYKLINDPSLSVVLNNNTILPLYGLRNHLNFFPLPKNTPIEQIPLNSKSYILGLLPRQKQVWLKYGNKLMTRLHPLYLPFDHSLKSVKLEIDGKLEQSAPARIIEVHKSFKVLVKEGYRVNVIGYTHNGASDEAGFTIRYKDLDKRFSIDAKGRIYRIEFYKNQAFSGMVLARFL
ncbi:Purine nucleoside phosphorylase [Helicobacter sp. NHP19-012]|uniref:Purine nucleoside phosphorylase n=1 Tax=Helicobacter gastrofelis TaxID=2849642 RepID=A0ABM7SDL6_9HELI|nr:MULTISPECIES: M99 family carboxypeptidase catalytic domain-containing protein [unclassified Helicobacter]BCZ18843.1 Purine nucleoside phosphorylase [Helicobacter sp. NHP19-012]GMB96254.1 Purine nucleoside phosphorylase [Helicobacter sp. NHP22-001]